MDQNVRSDQTMCETDTWYAISLYATCVRHCRRRAVGFWLQRDAVARASDKSNTTCSVFALKACLHPNTCVHMSPCVCDQLNAKDADKLSHDVTTNALMKWKLSIKKL